MALYMYLLQKKSPGALGEFYGSSVRGVSVDYDTPCNDINASGAFGLPMVGSLEIRAGDDRSFSQPSYIYFGFCGENIILKDKGMAQPLNEARAAEITILSQDPTSDFQETVTVWARVRAYAGEAAQARRIVLRLFSGNKAQASRPPQTPQPPPPPGPSSLSGYSYRGPSGRIF
jgi:hypothetical protein